MNKIQTGVTTVTFRKLGFERVLELLRKSEIDGVEWCACKEHFSVEDGEALFKIKSFCRERQLEVFSLATYCDLSDSGEFYQTVKAADTIGAAVIRVWAGAKRKSEYSDEEYRKICINAKELCGCAREKGIRIGLEFHPHTLTNTAAEAIDFLKDVSSDNLFLYWQTNESLTHEENISELKTALPYLCGNIHIHNYRPDEGYFPLCETEPQIMDYLRIFREKDRQYRLIIEFVSEPLEESFIQDLHFLKECALKG